MSTEGKQCLVERLCVSVCLFSILFSVFHLYILFLVVLVRQESVWVFFSDIMLIIQKVHRIFIFQ